MSGQRVRVRLRNYTPPPWRPLDSIVALTMLGAFIAFPYLVLPYLPSQPIADLALGATSIVVAGGAILCANKVTVRVLKAALLRVVAPLLLVPSMWGAVLITVILFQSAGYHVAGFVVFLVAGFLWIFLVGVVTILFSLPGNVMRVLARRPRAQV